MRLIVDPPKSGLENMSLDEALAHAVASGESPSTLRFYRWSEPTLSLGYFQSHADRQSHRASLHCPLVRRFSGGGAILHDQELTYSLALRTEGRFAERELYVFVHEALLEALAQWEIQAALFEGAPPAGQKPAFLCFERRTSGDVVYRSAKICGSAQRRVGSAVLQHGSLLLSRSSAAPELPGIGDLKRGARLDLAEFSAAWKAALERRLGLGRFMEGEWRKEENEAAKGWERQRYGETSWILRR